MGVGEERHTLLFIWVAGLGDAAGHGIDEGFGRADAFGINTALGGHGGECAISLDFLN